LIIIIIIMPEFNSERAALVTDDSSSNNNDDNMIKPAPVEDRAERLRRIRPKLPPGWRCLPSTSKYTGDLAVSPRHIKLKAHLRLCATARRANPARFLYAYNTYVLQMPFSDNTNIDMGAACRCLELIEHLLETQHGIGKEIFRKPWNGGVRIVSK
jgi:hypothetical protein